MVFDKPQDELTERDFRTLGIWPEYPEQKLILPRKRLDIPLPYRSGGFFNLSTELRWLADELDKTAKQPERMIDKIYKAKLRVEEVKAQFLELREGWQGELRDFDHNAVEPGSTPHRGAQTRDTERIDLKGLLGR